MLERLPPHNLEAEEAVLGSILIDNTAYYNICSIIGPDDFYRDKNRWVYEARIKLDHEGMVCDQVTMAHELASQERLEAIGGAAYLSHLVANVATSVHVVYYAEILKKLGDYRRLIRLSTKISEYAYNQEEDAYNKSVKALLSMKSEERGSISPHDLSEFSLGYYDSLMQGDRKPTLFGIPQLDKVGGMQPGELVVIGGETEMGKTTLLNQIARFQPGPVLFCTTEMTRAQWSQREIARLLKVPMQRLGNPLFIKDNWMEIMKHIEALKKSNVHVLVGSVTTHQIYAEAVKIDGLCLIVIDYLQRLKGVRANYESVSSASREIADIGKSLETPVILSSQLNRESQIDKAGKLVRRPLLTRLKDSGNIENDADWVMFIERNKGAQPKTPEFLIATLSVEKHRQGGDHTQIKLRFNPQEQRYEEAYEQQTK